MNTSHPKHPSERQGDRRLLVGARAVTLVVAMLGPVLMILSMRAGQVFASLVVVMTWMPAVILAVVLQISLVCPRCGWPFFRTGSRKEALIGKHANLFANRCLHCGYGLR